MVIMTLRVSLSLLLRFFLCISVFHSRLLAVHAAKVTVFGVRIDTLSAVSGYAPTGAAIVQPGKRIALRLFGTNLHCIQQVLLSSSDSKCILPTEEQLRLAAVKAEQTTAGKLKSALIVTIPEITQAQLDARMNYSLCVKPTPVCPAKLFDLPAQQTRRGTSGRDRVRADGASRTAGSTQNLSNGSATVTDQRDSLDDVAQGYELQDIGYIMFVRPKEKTFILPLPVQISLIVALLFMSGLFSGLNLGLMSLDNRELQIVEKCGNESERRYARQIIPIRRSGNFLLCTLLLGNVLVNSATTILMDDISNGLVAVVASSLGIVIFGEIVPQSICSRYGLAVGAKTRFLTMFFMILTFPLAWPISKILDCILGDEPVQAVQKERLAELLKQADVSAEPELTIATGALKLGDKTVKDVMTDIRYVYKVPADSVLDLNTVNDIVNSGYTRIPVYEEGGKPAINVVGLLNVKDLALLDPGDRIPVQTVCQYYRRPVRKVMDSMPLMTMMEEFKAGRYHMAFVESVTPDPSGSTGTYIELVGCVTLEDIIEEILQAEILDETDMVTDNRRRNPVVDREGKRGPLLLVGNQNIVGTPNISISKQVCMAAFQTLHVYYPAFFGSAAISEHVLQRLILQHVHKMELPTDPDVLGQVKPLYKKGEPTDVFVLILEGHVTVRLGSDEAAFDAGPFHCFGRQIMENVAKLSGKMPPKTATGALDFKKVAFKPDFTTVFTENVTWLQITANSYFNAYKTTKAERTKLPAQIKTVVKKGKKASGKPTVSISKKTEKPKFSLGGQHSRGGSPGKSTKKPKSVKRQKAGGSESFQPQISSISYFPDSGEVEQNRSRIMDRRTAEKGGGLRENLLHTNCNEERRSTNVAGMMTCYSNVSLTQQLQRVDDLATHDSSVTSFDRLSMAFENDVIAAAPSEECGLASTPDHHDAFDLAANPFDLPVSSDSLLPKSL